MPIIQISALKHFRLKNLLAASDIAKISGVDLNTVKYIESRMRTIHEKSGLIANALGLSLDILNQPIEIDLDEFESMKIKTLASIKSREASARRQKIMEAEAREKTLNEISQKLLSKKWNKTCLQEQL